MNINWEKIRYYLRKFWKKVKKFFKRTYKKTKKFLKIYFRQVKRYADAGDYRPIVFTAGVVACFILLVWLFISWIIPDKKTSSLDVATSLDATASYDTSPDEYVTVIDRNNPYIIFANNCLTAKQRYDNIAIAKQLYQENQDLLILVNEQHPLDETYTFEHKTLNCGLDVDARIYEPLKNMLSDLNAADLHYGIVSAYRSREEQQSNIEKDVKSYMASGMTEEEAYAKTYELVQKVGCSEHETGMCLDITPEGQYLLEETLEADPVEVWLMQNCYNYGFILRYPKDKESITGIHYEPWHYRYVGVPVATYLRDNNLTLEEFISMCQ